jgi:CheY-like chemotaxis protein
LAPPAVRWKLDFRPLSGRETVAGNPVIVLSPLFPDMLVLHSRLQAVLLELEAATHTRGALFLVRSGREPWPVRWAKGPDLLLGGDADALVGEPEAWWDAIVDDERDTVRAALADTGEDVVLEYRVAREGLGPRRIRESLRRVAVPEQGDFLVSVVRDVTREREAAQPAASRPTAALDPTSAGSRGIVVLLVEDDEAVRSVLARVLVREGFALLMAGSAAEALRIFEQAPREPQVLVTDVILPDRPGPELAQALVRRCPGLPVLLMSGYGHEELERRGEVALPYPLLPKPFTPADLVRAVRACIEARGLGERGARRSSGGGATRGPESAAC